MIKQVIKRCIDSATKLKDDVLLPLRIKKSYAFNVGGIKFSVKSPSDRQLAVMKVLFSEENVARQKAYFRELSAKDGDTLVDIGANIGYVSIVYSLALPASPIVALEPSRFNFQYLTDNTRSFSNVRPECFGAHHEIAELSLSMPSVGQNPNVAAAKHHHNSGLLSLYGTGGRMTEKAVLKPLDDHFELDPPKSRVAFVKIDVEGNEFKALEGARQTLATHSPALEIEINPKALQMAGASYSEIRKFLKDLGYRPYEFVRDALTPFEADVVSETVNMVFIRLIKEGK